MNVWKSYILTVDKDVNMKAIFAVMNTTWAVAKIGREKNSGLYGIWTHDRTGLNFFQAFFFTTAQVVFTIAQSLLYSRLYPQFKYMTFKYSQSFIHHFTGLFWTNIITSSQLAC